VGRTYLRVSNFRDVVGCHYQLDVVNRQASKHNTNLTKMFFLKISIKLSTHSRNT